MSTEEERLRQLLRAAPRSAEHLLRLLLDGLDWPIPDGLSWEDLQLEWEPEELHLDPDKVAKLKHISQVPKLTTSQTFGAWVLEFDGGRLPVGAIRRLVQRLVKNERARKGSGTHAQWALPDLLFFCLSEGQEHLLHVVNFHEKDGKRVLSMLSWSDNSTSTRLDLLMRRGVPDLLWSSPTGPKIVLGAGFGRGFKGYREGIKSAAILSRRMAEVAQDVRDEVRSLYDVETESGPIHALFNDVRDQLLGNLQPDHFADVYAQTMVYGLLTARIAHPEKFKAEMSVTALKFDNEFLDAIYSRFRDDADGIIDVDELGLNELAEQLAVTDVDELLADFGADNQRDDPVVYFYEEFLAQYDPEQRKNLGAFYTPLPVVRYIVKTVDDALKSFGLPLGVADPTTWAEYIETHPDIEIPKLARPEDAVVSMFDPANGTGTFLVEWIRQARRNAGDAGEATALSHASACEISLASYAVSHLKVSLEISEHLREQARLPIYLGDTLGPKNPHVIEEMADPISAEGLHADEVKYDWNHSVLIGNPPYDRDASDKGGFVLATKEGGRTLFDDILDDAKKHVIFSHTKSLNDLYVYFWRWAIWKVLEENSGPAVVSMITSSSWLAGPGFLGLRRLAREVADEISVVDLGGAGRGARTEENVFDIQTPVAIVTLIRRGALDRTTSATSKYARITGSRQEKLSKLSDLTSGSGSAQWAVLDDDWHAPLAPPTGDADWLGYPAVASLFPWQQPGCQFGRTSPVSPDRDTLERRWKRFVSTLDGDDRARSFQASSTGRNIFTRVGGYRRLADEPVDGKPQPIVRYGYRSFDRQWAFEDARWAKTESPSLWWSATPSQVFLVSMMTNKLGAGPAATVSIGVPDFHYFCGRGGKDVIPLYRDASGTPNADPILLATLTGLHQATDTQAAPVTVERLFAYTFGVLAGTDYTERFRAALDTPGPRVPITSDSALFEQMVKHGRRLIWLQTFGDRFGTGALPTAGIEWKSEPTRLPESRTDIKYDADSETLHIADGELTGLPEGVWTFAVSGMAIVSKWLGYRMAKPAGRAASSDSPLDHIRPTTWSTEWSTELVEIVAAIKETVAVIPDGVSLLGEIIDGPLIRANELPPAPPALQQPPKSKGASSEATLLAEDE